ncbi:hypothetical protein [Streptomyces resistomycificus]|nr:hypothetical protein [Streptomyces resistomycificus]
MPTNDLNSPLRNGNGDTPSTAGTHTDGPGTAGTHTDGPGTGGTHTDGPSTGGTHTDGPGTGGGSHEPPSTGGAHPGGGLDDLGGAGDDALGDAGTHADGTPPPGHASSPERPPFMRDGDNPYGPRGSLTPEQIKEIQVYRANHEPGYFKDHYYSDGRRLDTKIPDESGFVPVQMDVDPVTKVKTAASDAPPPIPAKYVDSAELSRGRHEVLSPDTLQRLDEAAAHRRSSIDYSMSAERHRDVLGGLDDADSALREAGNEYKSAMTERTKAAEAYGEAIAEHQFIPEHYPNATKETLHGPANGNDQFDQLWRREDGGFVVIEAKSNVATTMGKRDIPHPDGKRSAMQGSREYFMDILKQMESRGRKHPSEALLASELKIALAEGKLDYVLIKGKADGGRYAGYEKYEFDIG